MADRVYTTIVTARGRTRLLSGRFSGVLRTGLKGGRDFSPLPGISHIIKLAKQFRITGVREILGSYVDTVQRISPVDTGFYRSNWHLSGSKDNKIFGGRRMHGRVYRNARLANRAWINLRTSSISAPLKSAYFLNNVKYSPAVERRSNVLRRAFHHARLAIYKAAGRRVGL